MSEICLDCLKETYGEHCSDGKYILSKRLYLCEECGQYKKVVIAEREYCNSVIIQNLAFPFILLFEILKLLCKLIVLPYKIYKKKKNGG